VHNPTAGTLEEAWQRFIAEAEVRKLHASTGPAILRPTRLSGVGKDFAKTVQACGRSRDRTLFRDTFAVELLLAGVSTEEVAVLLGHWNIGITQKHCSPWVHSRRRQLEAILERAWNCDPIVFLNEKTSPKSN
jgi:site-specific recombinase XerD